MFEAYASSKLSCVIRGRYSRSPGYQKQNTRVAQLVEAFGLYPNGRGSESLRAYHYGEMSEWFKEPVLKTGDAATHREFESHSLRHYSSVAQ